MAQSSPMPSRSDLDRSVEARVRMRSIRASSAGAARDFGWRDTGFRITLHGS